MKNPTLKAKLAARRRKPLSPRRALEQELRTLARAEDKVVTDAVKDELFTENRYNKALTRMQDEAIRLRKAWDKHNAGRERRVGAALRNITARRNRLQARLSNL